MASKVELRDGSVSIGEKGIGVTLSKVDLLLSRDSKDVNALIVSKLGHEPKQVYYFQRDLLSGGFECISGPRGMREPSSGDWPSANRGR